MVGRWVARLPPSCSSPTVKRVVGRLFLLLPNSETGGCERGLMSVMTACWVYEGVRVNVSNGSQRLREALFLVNIPVSLLGSCSALLCLMSERWAQGRLEASLLLFPFHCWWTVPCYTLCTVINFIVRTGALGRGRALLCQHPFHCWSVLNTLPYVTRMWEQAHIQGGERHLRSTPVSLLVDDNGALVTTRFWGEKPIIDKTLKRH